MAEKSTKKAVTETKTTEETRNNYQRTLRRSNTNKVIGGVAGGIGEYFDIDPTLVRLIFILITVFGGSGVLIYIILWLVMPASDSNQPFTENTIRANAEDIKEQANKFAHDIRSNKTASEDSKFWFGLIIIVMGFLFLFNNLDIFNFFSFSRFWPLILVALGLVVLFKR